MLRSVLTAVGLLLYPLTLGAQNVDVKEREAVYTRVVEFVDSLITRERMSPVQRRDLRVFSLPQRDRPALERVAARMGARVARVEDVLVCTRVPDGRHCETSDGSRGGFTIYEASFSGSNASIGIQTWFLLELASRTMIAGQADRLHFSRSTSGWRLDHVERLGEMSANPEASPTSTLWPLVVR